MRNKKFELSYNLMLLPGMVFVFIFHFIPMFGTVIAFQKFLPAKGVFGSRWVGLDNFIYLFQLPDSRKIFINTVVIAIWKIALNLLVPFIFALLLNEIRIRWFKKTVQTIVYLPHFISWVVLASIIRLNLFSLDGIVNGFLGLFGIKPIFFMISNAWFRPIIIATSTLKEFGYGTIIYLAAMTGIDPGQYESAVIDGASRFQKVKYVTIPGIITTTVLLATLSLGNVLNAGFEQVFNLYNPLVYQTGDIIDTYVYRIGLVNAQYGLATAVGLMKSVISFFLVICSYKLAERFANYRIF